MAINPSKVQIIKDLLAENQKDFGAITAISFKIKEIVNERNYLEKSAHTDEQLRRVWDLTARAIGLYSLIRLINKDIRKRLDYIEHLKEVGDYGAQS